MILMINNFRVILLIKIPQHEYFFPRLLTIQYLHNYHKRLLKSFSSFVITGCIYKTWSGTAPGKMAKNSGASPGANAFIKMGISVSRIDNAGSYHHEKYHITFAGMIFR